MATIDTHSHAAVAHHDEHGHDHAHHGNFWTNYVFSEDHKVIAKQFLITGMAWALLGGAMSVIFRLQLGFPDANLSWLKPILGGWLTPEGKIDPEFLSRSGYYARHDHGVLCTYSWIERNV